MKNRMWIKLTLFSWILFCVVVSNCKDDENPVKPAAASIVGDWNVANMSSEYQGESQVFDASQLDSIGLIWILKFRNNHIAEQITNISGPLLTMPGTWSTSHNNLTLILQGPDGGMGTMIYQYSVSAHSLKLKWQMSTGMRNAAEFAKQ